MESEATVNRNKRLFSILEEVDIHGSVLVSTLADKLQVSEMTIRKDLDYLDQEQLLKRKYGGAEKCGEHFYKRSARNDLFIKASAKIALAKTAYGEINSQDTVIMDGSSTCIYLARVIRENPRKSVVLVTNSILAANEVMEAAHVNLILLGGNVQRYQAVTAGETVTEELKEIKGDICFFSPNGIDAEKGITVVDYGQMLIKRAMINQSEKTCILADCSKVGSSYASRVCGLEEIWKIMISGGGRRTGGEGAGILPGDNVYMV